MDNSDDASRNEIISKLPLHKSFVVRRQLIDVDKMSREQAIEIAKDLLVHLAYQESTFNSILKSTI